MQRKSSMHNHRTSLLKVITHGDEKDDDDDDGRLEERDSHPSIMKLDAANNEDGSSGGLRESRTYLIFTLIFYPLSSTSGLLQLTTGSLK